MQFTKMHGTGNDYVFVNCFAESVAEPESLARAVADRHTGIGSDGLILITPSERAAVGMVMFNADGSRGIMCGNGIRCVAKYAFERGLAADAVVAIETDDGVKEAVCTVQGGKVIRVCVDMGEARNLETRDWKLETGSVGRTPLESRFESLVSSMTCVSMGNPHAVIFVESLSDVDLAKDGPMMERHPLFPDGVNTHFVAVETPDRVKAVTWERGSGATQACGTGVSAVCVAGARTGRTNRKITVEVPGGLLDVEWREDNHVYLTGPAVEVFTGTWPT